MDMIEFNDVWKKFHKGEKIYTLRDTLPALTEIFLRRKVKDGELHEKEFWALQGVNFRVKKGEVLGVIGPNGAGKSTILKLLSGLMNPTTGDFKVKGRLSALIEVTAGFHADFTGRENVYFNGMVLGMTKKEIDSKFDEIVEFSGIGDFIDTPVKHYSSGMSARLGFSVAAHVDPEVLLIDEVLAVGDIAFRQKCARKMRELFKSGVTIILITHMVAMAENLCHRVIVLDQGKVVKEGDPKEAVPFYQDLMSVQQRKTLKRVEKHSLKRADFRGAAAVGITRVGICDPSGAEKEEFSFQEPISAFIEYDASSRIENPVFVLEVLRSDGILCCYSSSKDAGLEVEAIEGKGRLQVTLSQTPLSPGAYITQVSIWDSGMIHAHVVVKKGIFKILSHGLSVPSNSVILVDSKWEDKTKPSFS